MGTRNIDYDTLRARVQQEVLPEFYNWYLDKKEFELQATIEARKFSLVFVVEAIVRNYDYGTDRKENFVYDDAALTYIEKVAAIIRDMKEPEKIDISVGINHPSQVKANA